MGISRTCIRTALALRVLLRHAVVASCALALAATLALALLPAPALAWTPDAPLATPYPRLGMWWPDTESATPAQMARYDWIALGPWDDPAVVARIKALHADQIVLNATNACEVSFDPSLPASNEANSELAAVPAEWLLTQCGATLTAPIDASATTLHVSAVVTEAPGGGTIALFEADDYVVIGGELAQVTSVDATASTLTVRRGVVKAAASRSSGARVAAAISFWPGSLVMDLTSACPSVSVEASVGLETWAGYNARTGATFAETAEWDGLLVDRSDGNESWLVGNSTARSIDASRVNQVPSSYSAFDSAWNAGLLGYELRLRELVGEEKLLLANWGHPHYSALNGNNFEGFPNADPTAYPWQQTVVGPWSDQGSYFEWLSQARQPNLTTVETYEDDGSPEATDDGSYDNPAERPGFVPNYRKMRFGLASALLGDGFFSYEINTNGHGSLGLLWFDEYDGAGRGRGWLGAPSGSATRASSAGAGADLLGGNGGFESDDTLEAWDFSTEPGAAATITRDLAEKHGGASAARVGITAADGTDWHVSAAHGVAIAGGASYTLRLWARADATHTVNAWVQQGRDPWDNEIEFGGVEVGPAWREYELTGTSSASDASAQLVLALGASTGDVWLDDVRLTAGDPNVWLRRFSGGVSVVNATGAPATVPLGGLYRRLLGTRAPVANGGQLASSVTVPARDGIVLATPDRARISAGLYNAGYFALREHRTSRAIASHFAKRMHKGSRSSRARAKRAWKAWRTAAAKTVKLSKRDALAKAQLGSAPTALPATVTQLEADSLALLQAVKYADKVGRTTRCKSALRTARSARAQVAGIAVSPR